MTADGASRVEREVPVLIAGGGLVGLSTAMFLAQHGIASLAVERLRGGSQLPRAAFFHMRTLEMFRLAGIEDEVREQSLREFEPEGALVIMDTLSGRKLADIIPSLNEGVDALSPCRRLFVSQPGLEPILRRRAQGRRRRGSGGPRGGRRRAGRGRRHGDGGGHREPGAEEAAGEVPCRRRRRPQQGARVAGRPLRRPWRVLQLHHHLLPGRRDAGSSWASP